MAVTQIALMVLMVVLVNVGDVMGRPTLIRLVGIEDQSAVHVHVHAHALRGTLSVVVVGVVASSLEGSWGTPLEVVELHLEVSL
jgi:hypothetical protein